MRGVAGRRIRGKGEGGKMRCFLDLDGGMELGLTMWHTWIGLDFVVDVVGLEMFPSFFQNVVGEELVVFWVGLVVRG